MPELDLQDCIRKGAAAAYLRGNSHIEKLVLFGELVRSRTIVACIRILLITIWRLSSQRDFTGTLIRLSRAIRGVGDPLVAAYARCYLMRVGRERYVTDRSFMAGNVRDLLASYHQVS